MTNVERCSSHKGHDREIIHLLDGTTLRIGDHVTFDAAYAILPGAKKLGRGKRTGTVVGMNQGSGVERAHLRLADGREVLVSRYGLIRAIGKPKGK